MEPAGDLPGSSHIFRILAQSTMMQFAPHGTISGAAAGFRSGSDGFATSDFHPMQMTGVSESPQPRSLSASIHHKEAEKRRRERINSHLNELRNLLPCNSKTDKASLLARVVQRVRELKQRTSEIAASDLLPTETDEIAVIPDEVPGDGRAVFKASVCCEDRSDLLPDLIETLKSLRLKAIKAEMATLGGRVRNVLVIAGEDDDDDSLCARESADFLREALRALVDRSDSDRCKRRRIFERRKLT